MPVEDSLPQTEPRRRPVPTLPPCTPAEAYAQILREDAALLESLARLERIASHLDLADVDDADRLSRMTSLSRLISLLGEDRIEQLLEADGIRGVRGADLLKVLEEVGAS